MTAQHELIARRDATQATLDLFLGKPFAFGTHDCGQMLRRHLQHMGHRVPIAGVGSYRSILGAKRALRRLGHASLAEALSARFLEIAPAAALIGDVVAMESSNELDALGLALGNAAVLSFAETDAGGLAMTFKPMKMLRGWRVEPCLP